MMLSQRFQIQSSRPMTRRTSFKVSARHFERDNKFAAELKATAKYIGQRGKGILASDESNATCNKRLAAMENPIEGTFENRRDWREVLYTAPGLGQYISGAILFDETFYQSSKAGVPFVKILSDQGIKVGIKVDTGLTPLFGTTETGTAGLDGLQQRAKQYYANGARFAKWRAVVRIDEKNGCPSEQAILENAHALARYAQIVQSEGLVPIVEPEVLMDGDHDIETMAYWSERMLSHTFRQLNSFGVILEGILLKPNMVVAGADSGVVCTPEEVAYYTYRTLSRTLPPCVPAAHHLSGGLSEKEATENLQALQVEAAKHGGAPWALTFSYGRALQSSTQKAWNGKPENVGKAHAILLALAKANSEAQLGKYVGPHPSPDQGKRIWQALRVV